MNSFESRIEFANVSQQDVDLPVHILGVLAPDKDLSEVIFKAVFKMLKFVPQMPQFLVWVSLIYQSLGSCTRVACGVLLVEV
jgi:hypothetical protein